MPAITYRDTSGKSAESIAMRRWFFQAMIPMPILAVVAVVIRLISRRMRCQKLWWDDWLCILSMFWYLGTSVCSWHMFHYGMGYHVWEIDGSNFANFIQASLGGEIMYAWNVAITKISVLMLYHRLFKVAFQTSVHLRVAQYAVGAIVVSSAIIFMFLSIFICVPVQKAWQPEVPGYCSVQAISWVLNIALIILTDILVLLLPLRQVWKMRLATMEKLAILMTFAMGWFVTLISAYRVHLMFKYTLDDYSFTIAPTVAWSLIEISVGIVSACLPVSKPAFLWLTYRLGLTGESVLCTRRGMIISWKGFSSRSNSDPQKDSQQAHVTGTETLLEELQVPRNAAAKSDDFKKYFRPGDASLLRSLSSRSRATVTDVG